MPGQLAGTAAASSAVAPVPVVSAGPNTALSAAVNVSRPILAVLILLSLLAIAVPVSLVRFGPVVAMPRRTTVHRPPARIVSPAELPPVEPLAIENVDPDEARAFNATIPFIDGPNPAARPFRISGSSDDVARAADCLAAAVYYEAGDDAIGERAVAQVVLNRVRHPAFPKTVCGVVFQGSERPTGCQFTFTCDGSIARRQPSDAAWARARAVATMALHGALYAPVGWATHYHADFVVPYWQSSLDKLAKVHTQLFYRWSGWWGTAGAFRGRLQPSEPAIAQLARLSDAHRSDAPLADGSDDATSGSVATTAETGAPMVEEGSFLTVLPKGAAPDGYPALAAQACGDRPFCRYLAWHDKQAVPAALPLNPAQIATLSYSYVRDRSSGYEKSLWNCQDAPRRDPRECMKVQMLLTASPVPATTPTDPSVPAGPAALDGVHRKAAPSPGATPAATVAPAPPSR